MKLTNLEKAVDNKVENADLETVKDMIMELPTREDTDELFEKVNTDLLDF